MGDVTEAKSRQTSDSARLFVEVWGLRWLTPGISATASSNTLAYPFGTPGRAHASRTGLRPERSEAVCRSASDLTWARTLSLSDAKVIGVNLNAVAGAAHSAGIWPGVMRDLYTKYGLEEVVSVVVK
jgi:hypothetical protein